jgi:hypothetical protein
MKRAVLAIGVKGAFRDLAQQPLPVVLETGACFVEGECGTGAMLARIEPRR